MGPSRAGVIVSCELSDVGAWNGTQGFWKEQLVLLTTKLFISPARKSLFWLTVQDAVHQDGELQAAET